MFKFRVYCNDELKSYANEPSMTTILELFAASYMSIIGCLPSFEDIDYFVLNGCFGESINGVHYEWTNNIKYA